jgi:hypothetical protein
MLGRLAELADAAGSKLAGILSRAGSSPAALIIVPMGGRGGGPSGPPPWPMALWFAGFVVIAVAAVVAWVAGLFRDEPTDIAEGLMLATLVWCAVGMVGLLAGLAAWGFGWL